MVEKIWKAIVEALYELWYKSDIESLKVALSREIVGRRSLTHAIDLLQNGRFQGKEYIFNEWLNVFGDRAIDFIKKIHIGEGPATSQRARILAAICSRVLFERNNRNEQEEKSEFFHSF